MLSLALILDAIFGEPDWLWKRASHPAVVMGRWVGWLDRILNRGAGRQVKGVIALILMIIPVWVVAKILSFDIFFGVFEIIGAAILLAHRSLCEHVSAVSKALNTSLKQGRRAVAMIVGRETAALDESDVSRAAIESAAENFSDGVVAPAFWFLLLGLPGIAIYKVVNTADSMIGYRNEQYEEFGWAAARFDDVLNWLPARISAVFIALAGAVPKAKRRGDTASTAFFQRFDRVLVDSKLHRSPNAGWPEAATATALGIALSGPRVYEGVRTQDEFVNEDGRKALGPDDIDDTVRLLWRSWGLMLAIITLATLVML